MTNTLSTDIQAFLQKDTTKNFLSTAQAFVDLLEKDNVSKDQFCRQAHFALTDLYAAGQKLESIELKYSGPDYNCEKSDDELFINNNTDRIAELGKDVFYWEVFDPTYFEEDGQPGQGWEISDKEPTQGWLVDDFADIYRDLKIELEKIKLDNDAAVEDALWQLHFGFYHHWGNHCINAMRALHYLWYDGKQGT